MGNPFGSLCFGNTNGVVHHLYTRHAPECSNLAKEGARLSKDSGIDNCGYPACCSITSRGCTREKGMRSRIGPDVIALPKSRMAHYNRTIEGWTDDDHG